MKKSFPIISFVAMSFVAASAHPGYPKMYTQEEKIYALGVCWSELKFNFVGIEDITFDLDSLYRATLDRVIKTKNDVEFYRELDRFSAFSMMVIRILRLNIMMNRYTMMIFPRL